MNKPTLCQYIFIPKKPRMSKGKIASQVSKVAWMVLDDEKREVVSKWRYQNGLMTIVLQVKNQLELHNVKVYLEQENILFASYNDEGYTEVPAGTMTCIATGIIDKEKDGWRFEKYKLFR